MEALCVEESDEELNNLVCILVSIVNVETKLDDGILGFGGCCVRQVVVDDDDGGKMHVSENVVFGTNPKALL